MCDEGSRTFFETTKSGLRIRIRLTPSGRHDGVDGVMQDADGNWVLKASVTKAPEGGKANVALIKVLAKQWKLAKSSIEVIQGQTSRNKVLLITGDAATLHKNMSTWAFDKGLASRREL